MTPRSSNRREFLQAGAAAGLAVAAVANADAGTQAPAAEGAPPAKKNAGGIPLRPLGKTGEWVTMIGLGGHHSTRAKDEKDSLRLIRRAVDEGITFLDNAWDYHDGMSEERMGKAIEEGKIRDKVFLMTKCCGRTAKDAQAHLEDSLRRLRTDHLDLWQFHEICYDNDPDWIFAAGGAFEYAMKAKEQGKIRFLGFTGHKDPQIHLKMLGKPYDWATVQMPINVMDSQYRSFQKQVLPVLNQRGIGAIAMKSLGGDGGIVTKAGVPVEEALRYVFSLPISTLVSGMESEKVLEQNLKIAREFTPMTADQMVRVQAKVFELAGDGRFELFKSSKRYDGPYHRIQHGFSTDPKAV
jgi:predicted aldo/keto reductase-like oxidoreductase